MRISQYLLLFDLLVKYKFDKLNIISNILFRLKNISILANTTKVLKILFATIVVEAFAKDFGEDSKIFYVTFIKILDSFK